MVITIMQQRINDSWLDFVTLPCHFSADLLSFSWPATPCAGKAYCHYFRNATTRRGVTWKNERTHTVASGWKRRPVPSCLKLSNFFRHLLNLEMAHGAPPQSAPQSDSWYIYDLRHHGKLSHSGLLMRSWPCGTGAWRRRG